MNIVKMTRNGQVTIPFSVRKKLKANYYTCEQNGNGVLFKPINIEDNRKETKFTIEDFKAFSFEGRDKNEDNLAGKVDQITYGL